MYSQCSKLKTTFFIISNLSSLWSFLFFFALNFVIITLHHVVIYLWVEEMVVFSSFRSLLFVQCVNVKFFIQFLFFNKQLAFGLFNMRPFWWIVNWKETGKQWLWFCCCIAISVCCRITIRDINKNFCFIRWIPTKKCFRLCVWFWSY